MKVRIAIIPLLLSFGSQAEGAMLKGVILSNELSGPPMANVQVAVLDGANATVSDSVGRFTLVFPNREPGEKVQLIISHSDRVVVNYESLKRLLPKDPATETVTLLLCESRLVEEMRRRFYRLRSLTAIDENYARRIKALEQKNQATREALEKLREERDQTKGLAEEAAKAMARLRPEQISELQERAMALFLDGKIDESLEILKEEKLRSIGTGKK